MDQSPEDTPPESPSPSPLLEAEVQRWRQQEAQKLAAREARLNDLRGEDGIEVNGPLITNAGGGDDSSGQGGGSGTLRAVVAVRGTLYYYNFNITGGGTLAT